MVRIEELFFGGGTTCSGGFDVPGAGVLTGESDSLGSDGIGSNGIRLLIGGGIGMSLFNPVCSDIGFGKEGFWSINIYKDLYVWFLYFSSCAVGLLDCLDIWIDGRLGF